MSDSELLVTAEFKDRCSNVKTSLNVLRKRRHLTFPEGSAVVVSIVFVYWYNTICKEFED